MKRYQLASPIVVLLGHTRHFRGTIPANSIAIANRIGAIRFVSPPCRVHASRMPACAEIVAVSN